MSGKRTGDIAGPGAVKRGSLGPGSHLRYSRTWCSQTRQPWTLVSLPPNFTALQASSHMAQFLPGFKPQETLYQSSEL